jgi:phosphotransferase system HPr (HPr) family protein
LAGRFDSEVEVSRGEEWVSGTSVLSILSLAAAEGTVLRIKAQGEDAERAVAALGELIEAIDEG